MPDLYVARDLAFLLEVAAQLRVLIPTSTLLFEVLDWRDVHCHSGILIVAILSLSFSV